MRIQRLRKFLSFLPALRPFYRSAPCLIILIAIALGMPTTPGAQPACLPDGDVDQNGAVTAADALLVFQQALGLAQLDACQRTIADVFPQPSGPDGAITASDALCVFRKALGLPSCLDALPAPNLPPVADAGADQSVDAGVMVFLSGTGNDPDGTIASHAWTQTGGTPVSLTGSDAATAVFVAPLALADEELTFRLTVTDDEGAQASDEVSVTVHAVMAPVDQTSAAEVFSQHISGPVVHTKCINCHVANGASGHTRLVFVHASDTPDHEAQNLQTFQYFLAAVANEGGGSYVLNKIQGVGHGGGVQVSPGTVDFSNMQRFLSLLGEELAPSAPLTVETLFDTVIMASPRKTLRRAAIIFAGRIPTDEEYAAVEAGDEAVLRATIRGLMEGPQFHEFLIRASNDRLLTDRRDNVIADHSFVDYTTERYRLKSAARESGDHREYAKWEASVQFGARRAPLELIAHVVENDRPYTEILTADYIMANPWAAAAYGDSIHFEDPRNIHEFRPSSIVSYYRKGGGFESQYDPALGAYRILDPGSMITNYPHAGILNTTSFLLRYPTTATNRNRARARWTYYHFLGHDVEKSASRTTDPASLADINNPTMHNPACTVCHGVLDPVAGAFQNYSDSGFYRNQRGGLDSLDDTYKVAYWNSGEVFRVEAASWAERQTFSVAAWLNGDTRLILRHRNNYQCDDNGCVAVGRDLRLDELAVRDATSGALVHRVEWEALDEHCYGGQYNPGTGEDDHYQWWGWDCVKIPLDLPEAPYVIEVLAWADQAGDQLAEIAIGATPQQEGDTWYRDMRTPGFSGTEAPHPDNSLQWLAQRIVADDRFAEAAVKFWWPAIMGSEIAEFPEVATDASFDGLLLAANAQDVEVARLADGFRRGFPGSPYTYNLKDLLVEIVLSKWFRADAVTHIDPVLRVALLDAGARRLLTPEELARKTLSITGVQWGRRLSRGRGEPRWPSALTNHYRLLYGGIDSDGITDRARDITAVMAGVARQHAAQVSCPVVIREMYLLPDADRLLFAGTDLNVTPVLEFSASFKIEAESSDARETFSTSGPLTSGTKAVKLFLIKNMSGQKLRLDRLDVRDASGVVVDSREIEDVEWSVGDCGQARSNDFSLYCKGIPVTVQVEIPADGNYAIEIVAWGNRTNGELPGLGVVVESNTQVSAGSHVIRHKLAELYEKLLGVRVAPGSPDLDAAYRLFVDVWQRQSQDRGHVRWLCNYWGWDISIFEDILGNTILEQEDEYGYKLHKYDWDRINPFLDGIDFSDPHQIAQTWVVVLAAMMMDYRYLYL